MSNHSDISFESTLHQSNIKNKKPVHEKPQTPYEKWLENTKTEEEWIEICFRSESGIWGDITEELWLRGINKYGHSHNYLEALGSYYFRNKKPHKSLEALRPLLKKNPNDFTLKVAMSAAHHLHQSRLVWEYYCLFSESQKKSMEPDLLARAAQAAIDLAKFDEAQEIYTIMREQIGADPLPTLEESLLLKFKSLKKIDEYISFMNSEIDNEEKRKSFSISEIIRFSSALMFQGNYERALEVLLQTRSERYS